IPLRALTRTREGAYVMLDDNGHARQQEVRADSLEGRQWRVTDGLVGGERVILEGGALAQGQAVEAKPTPADASVGGSD
ncbi:efflux transporter periplasmic adaptor subunit, partial [Pseudomonas aeruginosa]